MKVTTGGVEVDVCQDGCGGVWFDLFELEKMDQPDESAKWLLENIRVDLEAGGDPDAPIRCPKCEGITLMRQKYSGHDKLMTDKCPVCGGIWLDFGELFSIRSGNPTTAEARSRSADLLRGLRKGG
jgi:uncharacterized protein